jgi:hypothetical protein
MQKLSVYPYLEMFEATQKASAHEISHRRSDRIHMICGRKSLPKKDSMKGHLEKTRKSQIL